MLLEAVPERLGDHLREVALISFDQALALVKSHFCRADLQRVAEGFAADADDEKIDALLKEARPVSNVIVDDLGLGTPAGQGKSS